MLSLGRLWIDPGCQFGGVSTGLLCRAVLYSIGGWGDLPKPPAMIASRPSVDIVKGSMSCGGIGFLSVTREPIFETQCLGKGVGC